MSKIQIRQGVFETNSSSTHSLTMALKEDYNKWVSGQALLCVQSGQIVTLEEGEEINIDIPEDDRSYCGAVTYDEWINDANEYYETFINEFKTPSGDVVVSFGYYGYD